MDRAWDIVDRDSFPLARYGVHFVSPEGLVVGRISIDKSNAHRCVPRSEWAKAKDKVCSDHLAQAHMTAPNADMVVMLFHRAFLGHDSTAGISPWYSSSSTTPSAGWVS